jgi:hypothetical protein
MAGVRDTALNPGISFRLWALSLLTIHPGFLTVAFSVVVPTGSPTRVSSIFDFYLTSPRHTAYPTRVCACLTLLCCGQYGDAE